MCAKEEWKWIAGYENYYMVSNLGKVKSVDRIVNATNGKKMKFKGTVLKQYKNVNGMSVTLSVEHFSVLHQVSRLVYRAFNKGRMPSQVYHLDGDDTNNNVKNLVSKKPIF